MAMAMGIGIGIGMGMRNGDGTGMGTGMGMGNGNGKEPFVTFCPVLFIPVICAKSYASSVSGTATSTVRCCGKKVPQSINTNI
jgi:hypothetical protein